MSRKDKVDLLRRLSDHRPRVGEPVTYRGEPVGNVVRVDGALCWVNYPTGTDPFIWCHSSGLNDLHDWPSKAATNEAEGPTT